MGKAWGFARYTNIDMEMVKSPAFQALTGSGVNLLILFLLKRKISWVKDRKNGRKHPVVENADSLTMTYIELESPPFGWSRPRITRAIDALLAKGFIEIEQRGGRHTHDKTVYSLSGNWRLWAPGCRPMSERLKDVHRGFQGAGKGAVAESTHASVTHTHTRERYPKDEDTHTRALPI